MVLTGDTLFIGDVGRPDLAAGGAVTSAQLAGQLYDSLHRKLLTLPDAVTVYPGHGAGSLCGKNISSETSSTIGQQRRFNYALQPMSREEFVRLVTTDLPEAPRISRATCVEPTRARGASASFRRAPAVRGRGRADAARRLDRPRHASGRRSMAPATCRARSTSAFRGSLLPGPEPSLQRRSILLVTEDEERVAEAQTRLARVGLENVAGHLDGE